MASAAALLLIVPSGCGPRAALGDGGGGASAGNGGGGSASSGSEGASGEACEAPMIECDGVCVDPRTDPKNCGQCGRICNVYTPGQHATPTGECMDGLCQPTFSEGGCLHQTAATSCEERCGVTHQNLRCVPGACHGATMVWEAGYWACDPYVYEGPYCEYPPESTVCRGEHPELALLQDVSCDMPISEAFALTGLPEKPPPLTEGPYAGWIPVEWRARCCCQRLPRTD